MPPSLLTFTHVREVVAAHIAAADKGQNGGSYLLGGENKSMLELVRLQAVLLHQPVQMGDILIKKADGFDRVIAEQAQARDDWR